MKKITKILKICIMLILLLGILNLSVVEAVRPNQDIHWSEAQSYEMSVIGPVVGLIRTLGTILAVFLMIPCMILGGLYLTKSQSSKGKKIIIGVLIIAAPFILFFLSNILGIFFI